MKSETIIGGLVVLVLLGVAGYFFFYNANQTTLAPTEDTTVPTDDTPMPVEPDGGIGDGAGPIPETDEEVGPVEVIGQTVNGNDITAYHFGEGDEELLLVAGVHGAYAANTSELAHELREYLEDADIPENLRVTVIPTLNPDGLETVYEETDVVDEDGESVITALSNHDDTIPGRFNANEVDLNRNFACDWAATSMWRSQEVSGGSASFSEPEAKALRDYIRTNDPIGAIVWFSAEGKVYPSACEGDPSSASEKLAAVFADAADYPTEEEFDAYAINGDMVNWMASQSIPAISVLLSSHKSTDTAKNQAGLEAVLKHFAKE